MKVDGVVYMLHVVFGHGSDFYVYYDSNLTYTGSVGEPFLALEFSRDSFFDQTADVISYVVYFNAITATQIYDLRVWNYFTLSHDGSKYKFYSSRTSVNPIPKQTLPNPPETIDTSHRYVDRPRFFFFLQSSSTSETYYF